MSARREAGRRHDALPATSEEIGGGEPGRDQRDDPDRPDDLERGEDVDHRDLDAHDDPEPLEDDPDEVPVVNAWLTIVMFAVFVVTTVGCYFLLDGWH